jgi:hypothetical protein
VKTFGILLLGVLLGLSLNAGLAAFTQINSSGAIVTQTPQSQTRQTQLQREQAQSSARAIAQVQAALNLQGCRPTTPIPGTTKPTVNPNLALENIIRIVCPTKPAVSSVCTTPQRPASDSFCADLSRIDFSTKFFCTTSGCASNQIPEQSSLAVLVGTSAQVGAVTTEEQQNFIKRTEFDRKLLAESALLLHNALKIYLSSRSNAWNQYLEIEKKSIKVINGQKDFVYIIRFRVGYLEELLKNKK